MTIRVKGILGAALVAGVALATSIAPPAAQGVRQSSVQAPKQIIATDALPLTGLGKPDKKALNAQFWTGDRAVG